MGTRCLPWGYDHLGAVAPHSSDMESIFLQKGYLEDAEADVQQDASPAACWAAAEQQRSCLHAAAIAEAVL